MSKRGRPVGKLTISRHELLKRIGALITNRRMDEMTPEFMEQLDRCKDDAARRLLLGVSR